jgi:hypothetical protein
MIDDDPCAYTAIIKTMNQTNHIYLFQSYNSNIEPHVYAYP